jgi:hypothetical protein
MRDLFADFDLVGMRLNSLQHLAFSLQHLARRQPQRPQRSTKGKPKLGTQRTLDHGEGARIKEDDNLGVAMTISINTQQGSGRWNEYYRRRNWARLAVLGLAGALGLLPFIPVATTDAPSKLPPSAGLAVVIAVITLAVVGVAAPVLRWMEWLCPRCHSKFAESKYWSASIFMLVPLIWRLVYSSRCGHCGLHCGAESDSEITR